MLNPTSRAFDSFMASIASPLDTQGFSGYTGGLPTKTSTTIYYSSWRGLEVVFHCAPLLTDEQRRQFIGNDKVLLHVLEDWPSQQLVVPKFRGNVNTVSIVARPLQENPNAVFFQSYHRLGMGDVKPAFPDEPIALDHQGKQMLFAKLVNAHVDAYTLLFGDRMKRAWDEELQRICDQFMEKKKATGGSGASSSIGSTSASASTGNKKRSPR